MSKDVVTMLLRHGMMVKMAEQRFRAPRDQHEFERTGVLARHLLAFLVFGQSRSKVLKVDPRFMQACNAIQHAQDVQDLPCRHTIGLRE